MGRLGANPIKPQFAEGVRTDTRRLAKTLCGYGYQAINMARIVSLYYIGIWWPHFFQVAHGYVWQSLVILFAMVLWIFWAERFARRSRPAPG